MKITQHNSKFNFIKRFGEIIPDSDCLLCRLPVSSKQTKAKIICEYCHLRLPILRHTCSVCSLPLAQSSSVACGECLKLTPPFTKTVAAFHYEAPISDFITSLKFNHQQQIIPLLTEYLYQRVIQHYQQDHLPQQLLAVPLHAKKIKQRGFNQAQLITRHLSKMLNIPSQTTVLSRTRNTSSQVNLDAIERQRNLKDAFRVEKLPNQHVAIIDDVMTTGTTVSELSRVLIKAGAKRVDVWCVARAFSM